MILTSHSGGVDKEVQSRISYHEHEEHCIILIDINEESKKHLMTVMYLDTGKAEQDIDLGCPQNKCQLMIAIRKHFK